MRKQLIKAKRLQKLLKYDWIDRMAWIKQINHIQFLAPQDVDNEEGC